MSTLAHTRAHSGPPPAEEDLQKLYEDVLAGFNDESYGNGQSRVSAGERDLDSLLDQYTTDDHTGEPSRPPNLKNTTPTPTSPASTSGYPSPRDANRRLPSVSSPTQSSSSRRQRPLPQVPGGSSSPMPSPGMPVPDPYMNGSVDSNGPSSIPRSLMSGGGRPGSAKGLPSSVRPQHSHGSSTSLDSPSSVSSPYSQGSTHLMPTPEIPGYDARVSPANSMSASVTRRGSHRPPGTAPPKIPGHDGLAYHEGEWEPSVDGPAYTNGNGDVSAAAHHERAPSYVGTSQYPPEKLGIPYADGPTPTLDRAQSYMTTATSHTMHSQQSDSAPSGSTAPTTVQRMNSVRTDSSYNDLYADSAYGYQSFADAGSAPTASGSRSHQTEYDRIAVAKGPLGLHDDLLEEEEDEWDADYSDLGDDAFANFSLLSHIAVRLRDKVPRGTHVKGSIPYPRAFTGKDIVSTIQSQIQRDLLINHGVSTSDRRAALQVARSLQSQLFFYEVEWGGRVLQDGVEDVYMFLDDQEGGADAPPHAPEREELPTGVVTMLTKCYSPSCSEEEPCYSYSCPLRQGAAAISAAPPQNEAPSTSAKKMWTDMVPKEVLDRLPQSEIRRQTIIQKVVSKEEDYVQDLTTVETLFIKPLRQSNVIRASEREDFIEEVFGNILDLRQCNINLLEELYVRQREQTPVIQRIGDIFLEAATQFRLAYPIYVGHLPLAEKRLKEELEENSEFRLFLEDAYRHIAKNQATRILNLKHFLTRPSEHLQKYPVLLDAIFHETAEGNPDADYLSEAMQAIKNLQTVAQLRTFQSAMGRGPTKNWQWHDLISKEDRLALNKVEAKRQSVIFELIKGEMEYVRDLESIDTIFVQPLRERDPPIIPRDRLESFIRDVFHNFQELHAHHRRLLNQFHEIQREEHPIIRSLIAPLFDAALHFRDAYMEYVPNYPIAKYRIEDEIANNPEFKAFYEEAIRHPLAERRNMKDFINRPIPRLVRYNLLLKSILDETPPGHEDIAAIPQVEEVIKSLGKETEPGVASSEQKVELWRYNSNLVFKPGETIDMDLLDENRSLIHTGKLLRPPDTGFEWNGWSELFVILFDNYLVMTKPKERDGITKYQVNRRPIPLDLLTLANFVDPPTQRSSGIQRIFRTGERSARDDPQGPSPQSASDSTDSRAVYPCTVHHNGRLGGLYTLYAETAQSRALWKQKLEEAIGLRKAVQENNKVFEIETLSADTFLVPSILAGAAQPSWNQENSFTGKVTCSVPFTTADGRGLVAIGCAEGVWIGFRHDSRSMRRVLHLKMVTQCAMLSDFGIFLVLADKSLFAYHIEALVPSSPQGAHNSQPQKLNGTKDVHFFSVGSLHGRTLVIYMKKKGLDSVFRVLEPVMDKISERTKAPASLGSRLGLRTPRSDWFRIYRDFFLPSESFDLIFLKAKIAILCTKGFEIMDLTDFKSVTIPQRDDPRLEKLAKRCESCKPIGMFRSNDEEFLLCYDEFGLYVDKHGDPSRSTGTIEWEGTADRVALHGKYILLFDSRFIEVRHVETGRLAQIIPGNDVRCIWDGRGVSNIPGSPDGFDGMSQEPRVHGVVNATEGGRATRAVTQHVFELVPTIPLYLPGSLASPSTAPYFPQSSSPPHSPRLNPALAWR